MPYLRMCCCRPELTRTRSEARSGTLSMRDQKRDSERGRCEIRSAIRSEIRISIIYLYNHILYVCIIGPNAYVGVWLLVGTIAHLCLCVVSDRVCAVDSHRPRLCSPYASRRCIALLVRCVALCGCVCVVNRAALICGLLGLACLRLIVTCLRLIVICLLNCLLLSKAPARQPPIALHGPSPSQGHAYAYAGAGLVDVCVCARSSNTAYVECMFALKSFCDLVWLEVRIVSILISSERMSL